MKYIYKNRPYDINLFLIILEEKYNIKILKEYLIFAEKNNWYLIMSGRQNLLVYLKVLSTNSDSVTVQGGAHIKVISKLMGCFFLIFLMFLLLPQI